MDSAIMSVVSIIKKCVSININLNDIMNCTVQILFLFLKYNIILGTRKYLFLKIICTNYKQKYDLEKGKM